MNYLAPLIKAFEENSDKSNAVSMANYMKNHFDFMGIKSPLRRKLQDTFFRKNGLPNIDQLPSILNNLWSNPKREYQYFALDLLIKMRHKVPEDFLIIYKNITITKSWWDTVDLIASNLIGFHLKKYPHLAGITDDWSIDSNLWLRRTALLHQLKYKEDLDKDKLSKYIEANLGSEEFFINKAIGWILREYAKTNPEFVVNFVSDHPNLANLSKTEALKKINS